MLAWNKIKQKILDIYAYYIKLRPKHRQCGQTKHNWFDSNFVPLLRTVDLGTGIYFTPWWALRGYDIHTQGHRLLYDCWLYWYPIKGNFTPFMPGRQRIINGPPSKPHLVVFYDMQGEGRLLLPRSSTVPFYIDLRPKDGYTFAPFRWLYCGSNERRHLLTNRNILRYSILVYVNIHKKYYSKVCVCIPA